MSIQTIRPADLHAKVNSGEAVELIDVRTPAEFQSLRATIARNTPLESLKPKQIMGERNGNASAPLYVICKSGSRAEMACRKFIELGFTNVVNVAGGTLAWDASGLPIIRGERNIISVDRQMRIVAGSLVVLGVALGFFVHPYWVGLSAFVGCGLIFAGVTDICPMLSMLSRMPWNQGQSCGSCK